jgi:hypothetical protein
MGISGAPAGENFSPFLGIGAAYKEEPEYQIPNIVYTLESLHTIYRVEKIS